jgi:DNA-binding response OmpR family regulator
MIQAASFQLVEVGRHRILVVEDDAESARVTAALLRRAGYEVEVAAGGQEAVSLASARAPDLMLLDFDMPDMDATEVIAEVRRTSADFPILILTGARMGPGDEVLGLERGASDYVLKGVDRQVLLARIRKALRSASSAGVVQRGRLRIDPGARRAWLGERLLQLEPKPFSVLHQLALREGSAVSRQELLSLVWETAFQGYEHSVSQAVLEVRRAMGDRNWIQTVHGHGYRFVTQP